MASEDAPEEVKARYPGTELIGNRFVLAAEADMELGRGFDLDGDWRLVAVNPRWEPVGDLPVSASQTVG